VQELTKLYARRMTLEEFFRDVKIRLCGWGLRDTLITGAGRLKRMLLIPALVSWTLLAVALLA
jgi:hypothetical protein